MTTPPQRKRVPTMRIVAFVAVLIAIVVCVGFIIAALNN